MVNMIIDEDEDSDTIQKNLIEKVAKRRKEWKEANGIEGPNPT